MARQMSRYMTVNLNSPGIVSGAEGMGVHGAEGISGVHGAVPAPGMPSDDFMAALSGQDAIPSPPTLAGGPVNLIQGKDERGNPITIIKGPGQNLAVNQDNDFPE